METPALKAAIELTLMPSRARAMRDGPLPDGVPFLLRIAAGDEAAEQEAVRTTERPPKILRESAAFFIEQMMLHPEADSYRVLGATSSASTAELRQNMALLMRWLHPDKNPRDAQAVFVNRVNRAWDTLKTAERREAYDQTLRSRAPVRSTNGSGKSSAKPRKSGGMGLEHNRASGRRSQPPGYQRRNLVLSDLLGPGKAGREGLVRRLIGFLLRARY